MRLVLLCLALAVSIPAAAQDRIGSTFPIGRLGLRPIPERGPDDPKCRAARNLLAATEDVRARTHAVRQPPVHGQPTEARLRRWPERALASLLERAWRDVNVLDTVAHTVFETGCIHETIVVLAARGRAYEALFDAIERVPGPSDRDPELVAMYDEHTPRSHDHLRDIAVRTYRHGLELARRHGAYGTASRACIEGLVRLGELPPHEELVPARAWTPPVAPEPVDG